MKALVELKVVLPITLSANDKTEMHGLFRDAAEAHIALVEHGKDSKLKKKSIQFRKQKQKAINSIITLSTQIRSRAHLPICCGSLCVNRVDASHVCILCDANCCLMCVKKNSDGSHPNNSIKKLVFCNAHSDGVIQREIDSPHWNDDGEPISKPPANNDGVGSEPSKSSDADNGVGGDDAVTNVNRVDDVADKGGGVADKGGGFEPSIHNTNKTDESVNKLEGNRFDDVADKGGEVADKGGEQNQRSTTPTKSTNR